MTKTGITPEEMKTLLKAQQGELDAVAMYQALADTAKDPDDKKVFRQLSAEEGRHAAVFAAYTGKRLRPKKTKAVFVPLLYRFAGKKTACPLIAKGEYDAAHNYEKIISRFPEVESVKTDEERHGDMVKGLLK